MRKFSDRHKLGLWFYPEKRYNIEVKSHCQPCVFAIITEVM